MVILLESTLRGNHSQINQLLDTGAGWSFGQVPRNYFNFDSRSDSFTDITISFEYIPSMDFWEACCRPVQFQGLQKSVKVFSGSYP
jgi:hypothetical protein